MRYLKISNLGEIEPEALTLLGASTKRGDSSKIGFFGTGNKYALAYLLRNGYDIGIFSGLNRIDIGLINKTFGSMTFQVITINGKETSITTETGIKWELEYAIRELS